MLVIFSLPILLGSGLILLLTMSAYRLIYQPGRTKVICETEACKSTAQRLLEYMDPTVKPCDDFYRFSCGQFIKTAEIQDDQKDNCSFTQLNQLMEEQLKAIMYESPSRDDPLPYRHFKHLFFLCMDEEKIDGRGVGHALTLLQEAGGWPVLGSWTEDGWSFLETEKKIINLALRGGSFFQIVVDVDFKKNVQHVLSVDQPQLGIPREYLVNGEDDPIVQAYYNYMVDIAVMYGANRQTATEQMKEVLLFEIELASITVPKEERRDFERMYNPYGLQDLMSQMGWVNWVELLESMAPKSVPLDENELIIVYEVDYLKRLKDFLPKYQQQVIANYMMWLAAKSMTRFLTSDMKNRRQEFKKVLYGTKGRQERWKECVKVASRLDLALSSEYVRRFFNKQSKQEALKITEHLKEEISRLFKELDWLNLETRKLAEFKASKVVNHIGYPDELVDIRQLQLHYNGLTLNAEHYFEAMLDLYKWTGNYYFSQLREEVNKTDWRTHGGFVIQVNAFYNPLENSMIFPAGILQQPFFNFQLPKYINYATIGYIMGHELTHGFDDEGCQFNFEGELQDWWDEASKEMFKNKKQCIIDQYSDYKDVETGLNLNGINTQGENVADNGGAKLAFRAYRRVVSKLKEPEPLLPGLQQYSRDQLFFLSMANMWCSKYRLEALKDQITTNEHSPQEFRVNGVLKNLPEFSKAFRCSSQDSMNPPKKCCVW